MDELLQALLAEYDRECGFIGRLRAGEFDEHAMHRLLELVRSIDLGPSSKIDRELVSLLWMIPSTIAGPVELLKDHEGGQKLILGAIAIELAIADVLGVP